MSANNLIVLVAIVAVIVLLVAVCLFLLSRNRDLRVRYDDQVRDNVHLHQQVSTRTNDNLQLQSQLNTLASQRFEEWRDRELDTIMKQLREVAYSEARAKMDEWHQNGRQQSGPRPFLRAVLSSRVGLLNNWSHISGSFPTTQKMFVSLGLRLISLYLMA